MSDWWRQVDRFWNGGIDDRVYGWLRMGFAVVAFLNAVHWLSASDELLSSAGINSLEAASSSPHKWAEISIFVLVRDPVLVNGLIGIVALVHVLLFFGVGSRCCLVFSLYWHVSYQNWAALGTAGWDSVLGNVCFILMVSPTGKSVRPGAWIRSLLTRQGGSVSGPGNLPPLFSPRYGVYLLRFQLFLIYWVAVVTRFPDEYWKNGDSFGYYLLSDFCWFGGPWVLEATWLVRTATWGAQFVEFLIPLLLLGRRTWKAGFALGFLFHLALAITTTNLILFSLSMMMIYLAFVRFPETGADEPS